MGVDTVGKKPLYLRRFEIPGLENLVRYFMRAHTRRLSGLKPSEFPGKFLSQVEPNTRIGARSWAENKSVYFVSYL